MTTTLAHERHHLRRFPGPGPPGTLGANLLAEGLAQCFQEEIGCPIQLRPRSARSSPGGTCRPRTRGVG
ncbi:hypothetical protein HPY23_18220 [Methylobacterium sp. IF7SW-B2]|nr:hypothetical protein [Methylobacterium ajmalii]MBK3409038.1 hypothetical protein [Methylobacterium ajmalii]MBK3420825.1 hypothetical protein [Methylobacterium ajmalii]